MHWKKWLLISFIALALGIGAGSYYFHQQLQNPQKWLQRFANSQNIKLSGVVKTTDSNFFTPAFKIDQLDLKSQAQGWSVRIKSAKIQVNLLKTLWHWRLSTDLVRLQNVSAQFDLDRYEHHATHQTKNGNMPLLNIAALLNAQSKVDLQNVLLKIKTDSTEDQLVVNAGWNSSEDGSQLSLMAKGSGSEAIQLQAKFAKGTPEQPQAVQMNLKVTQLLLSWFNLFKIKVDQPHYRLNLTAGLSGNLQDAKLTSNFALQNLKTGQAMASQPLAGSLLFSWKQGQGQLTVSKLLIKGQAYPQPIVFNLKKVNIGRPHWQIDTKAIQLQPLLPFLSMTTLNKKQAALWQNYLGSAQGEIDNIEGRWYSGHSWQLQAQLKDLSLPAGEHTTGFKGFSGQLTVDPDKIQFDLLSDNLELLWPLAEKRPATPAFAARAHVAVHAHQLGLGTGSTTGIRLVIDRLRLHNQQAEFGGKISLVLAPKRMPVINARLDYQVQKVSVVKRLLPKALMDPELYDWLQQALVKGHLKGLAVLNGNLADFPFTGQNQNSGQFFVQFDVADATLNPGYGWPLIEDGQARVMFVGPKLLITAKQGVMQGILLRNVRAEMPDIMPGVPTWLAVRGSSDFNMKQGFDLLLNSPLKAKVEQMNVAKGEGHLDLSFSMPFGYAPKDHKKTKINGALDSRNATLSFVQPKLTLSNLTGKIYFNDQGALSTRRQNVRGKLYGLPLQFSLQSKTRRGQMQTSAHFHTWLSLPLLQAVSGLKSLDAFVQGQSPVSGEYSFSQANDDTGFKINSQLQGLTLKLPAPFNKTKSEKVVLAISKQVHAKDATISGQYGKDFKVVGGLEQQKLVLNGHTPALNLNDWGKVISKVLPAAQASAKPGTTFGFKKVALTAGELTINDQKLTGVTLGLAPKKKNMVLSIDSSKLAGLTTYTPANAKQKQAALVHLDFKKTDLDVVESIYNWYQTVFNSHKSKQTAKKTQKTQSAWPKITGTLNQVQYHQYHLDTVSLNLLPTATGYTAKAITAKTADYSVDAHGVLNLVPVSAQTPSYLKGKVDFKNIGKALTSVGVNNLIGGGNGAVSFDLEWPGRVMDFDLKQLIGRLQVNFKEGYVTKVNPGLISLINVFNVDSFWNRIKFDSHAVLKEGLAFNEFTGLFSIFQGNLFTNDTVVKGPDLQLSIGGRIGFVDHDVDLLVGAVPQVSGSIPVIALAAGGLTFAPVAGALWLFEKAISNEVKNPFVLQYHVFGPWSDIQTQSVKAGDEGTTKPKATPAKPDVNQQHSIKPSG